MDTKELIRRALREAIAWNEQLMAATYGRDEEGYKLAKEHRDGYAKILKRRYRESACTHGTGLPPVRS